MDPFLGARKVRPTIATLPSLPPSNCQRMGATPVISRPQIVEIPGMDTSSIHLRLVLTLLYLLFGGTQLEAQGHQRDYDDVDPWSGFVSREPAADSAAVAGFLNALAACSPILCQMAVALIGNHWGHGNEDLRIGILAGEATLESQREALSRSITDPAAIGLLTSSLADPHPCVRRAAARMLGESHVPDALRQLRTALRGQDPRGREAAALGLADAEDPASFHDLTGALKDRDQSVVRMAAYALGELEDARAVKPLAELLKSKDAGTRTTAAWALGAIEDIRAAEQLTSLVKDDDPEVRLAAVEALGEIEDYRATGALSDALKDRDVRIRRAAARGAGRSRKPEGCRAADYGPNRPRSCSPAIGRSGARRAGWSEASPDRAGRGAAR